jgi:maltose O-acetyltransferase
LLSSHIQRRNSISVRYRLRDCDSVGDGVILRGTPYINNLGHISLARDVELVSSPVVSHLVTGPSGRIEIGRGARIGHGAAVAAYEKVAIGEGTEIGPFALIMDTDFHQAGNSGAIAEAASIYIGANALLGSRVTVLRGARIGDGAVVAAGSVVSGDVRAGARVSGVPARESNGGMAHEPQSVSSEAVARIIARTFGLANAPNGSATREQIDAWDSLGSLNLLLALEEAFGVSLRQEDVIAINTVDQVTSAVRKAALH